jgi:TPR repeat protein
MVNTCIKVNNADAFFSLGTEYLLGDEELKLPQNRVKGLQLLHHGGKLGSAKSYYQLACAFWKRDDVKKARHFHELASISGNVGSRHNLGVMWTCMDKAIKHYMIAAGFGNTISLRI